ncbi:MAG: AEC family transporter [Clostridia bacterium]|nr:AEC family transporter [Clostridia bacterium]
MENIILAFKVVFPILVYISLGYFFKSIKLYDTKGIKVVNDLVFKLFLPCLLFYNIYTTKVDEILNIPFIIYAISFVVIMFIILMVTVPFFIRDNSKCGVFIQGIFRSNFVLFGLPVSTTLLSEGNAGLTSLSIAFIVPLYNVLAVICLERFRKNKVNFWAIIKGILKNPLIIASALGVVFLVLDIKMPDFCGNVVRDLSRVATPLALVGLGGSFTFSAIKGNTLKLMFLLLFKLLIVPFTAIFLGAYVFGFEGAAIVTLISAFASPTAVSSFTMAQSMGGDSDLAAQTVVFTSVFSILTVFFIVAVTKSLNLF